MTEVASLITPLEARPLKNTICLFDVDGTLTLARQVRSPSCYSRSSTFLVELPLGCGPVCFANRLMTGCLPRNYYPALSITAQVRYRVRRWLRSDQTAGTAWNTFATRHCSIRLLLRREWTHCLPNGKAPYGKQLH